MSSAGDCTDTEVLDDSTLEISPAATHAVRGTETRQCENCGATLTGRYCAQCGQRDLDHPVHHFWHFVGEATEDLTHADSRLWQTLFALMFRPGFLTREFLDGRRARYLPPVRLYLVVSVLFFLIVSLHSFLSPPAAVPVIASGGSSMHHTVKPAAAIASQVTAELGTGNHTSASVAQGVAIGLTRETSTPSGRKQLCRQAGSYVGRHAGWFDRLGSRVTQSCLSVDAQGGTARLAEAVEHNLERAMFLFLPLLALAMKPLYVTPRRYYVEHLLFFLHNHAFLFVLLGLDSLLMILTSSSGIIGFADTVITLYIPIYFYLSMRRVYAQGYWLTFTKLVGLGVVYAVLGTLLFTATVSYSFLML